MNRRLTLASMSLLLLTECGGPPPAPVAAKPPPVLSLTISGGPDQNPDAAGRASPVAVRIYQLSGAAKFEQTDVFALKDREAQTLGGESQGSQEFLIAPAESKTVTIPLKPMVSAIGVAVMYRDIDHAVWREVKPAAANGQTKITVLVGRLRMAARAETPDPPVMAGKPEKPDAVEAGGLMGMVKGMMDKADTPAGQIATKAGGTLAETAAGKIMAPKK